METQTILNKSDWKIASTMIGKGSEGQILVATKPKTKEMSAVKIIDKKSPRILKRPQRAHTEMKMYMRIQNKKTMPNVESDKSSSEEDSESMLEDGDDILEIQTIHPNIVKLIDAEENENQVRLYLEYCENGSLGDFLKKHPNAHKNLKIRFFAEILEAVCYLHDIVKICHRDIKVFLHFRDS